MTMKKILKSAMILAMLVLALALLSGCGAEKERIPEGAEICGRCNGTKLCQVCDGDGVLELTQMLGGYRQCSFCMRGAPGACNTCKGMGYVISRR